MSVEQLPILQNKFKRVSTVPERSENPIIKVDGLAYTIVGRSDLDKAEQFYNDFGLITASKTSSAFYLKGVGEDPCLVVVRKQKKDQVIGLGLRANTEEELNHLANVHGKNLQTAEYPGGGKYITLTDPDGVVVEVIAGQTPVTPVEVKGSHAEEAAFNNPKEKGRVNKIVRFPAKPANIYRIGHTAFSGKDITKTLPWYLDNFGFIVSDFEFADGVETPLIAFVRCDRGDKPTDHHTMGIGAAINVGHLHTAFEVKNFDAVGSSGDWLRQQGYKQSWGVGRHTLCSAVFDYWRDPWDTLYEHYTDCDVFDNTVPTGYHGLDAHAQHQWGPTMPKDMIDVSLKRAPALIGTLVKRLATEKEFTLSNLKKILKAVS